MYTNSFIPHAHGYSEDRYGFTGIFSYWRSHTLGDPRWVVISHIDSGFASDGHAVIDNFGNLVRVRA
jgi:hypothetical protein